MLLTVLHVIDLAAISAAAMLTGLGALALLHPRVRSKAASAMAAIDDADAVRVDRAVWLSGAFMTAWVGLLEVGQYLAFQFHMDTVSMANAAANFIAGRGLACPALGTSTLLSVHFSFIVPVLLGPILLIWRSALPLLLVQGTALASVGPAAFLLARRRTGSAALGVLMMLLAWSHVSFHELTTANLDNNVFGPPLFLWGLVLWDAGRRGGAGLLWALALTTREQFPFTLAGLGAYCALSPGRPWRRRLLEGGGVVLASAAIWFLEMRVISFYGSHLNDQMYWTQYASLGASRQDVIHTVFTRPDRVIRLMLWPPSHLAPLALLVSGMALLPLADPAALVALLISATHHLLLPVYMFKEHYASYTFGPLLFATTCGLAVVSGRGRATAAKRVWLVPPVLAAATWGLLSAPTAVQWSPGDKMAEEAPGLMRFIPPGASVWADHNVAVHLAARPQMKNLLTRMPADRFDVLLFRPEYVLVQKVALLAMAPYDQARIVGFLAREGYRKAAESRALVLLQDPQAPRRGDSPVLSLHARPDDAARVAPFIAGLLDSADARERLAAYPPDLRYEPETAEQHVAFARVLAQRGLFPLAAAHNRAALALMPSPTPRRTSTSATHWRRWGTWRDRRANSARLYGWSRTHR